jgi:hypothetical protein
MDAIVGDVEERALCAGVFLLNWGTVGNKHKRGLRILNTSIEAGPAAGHAQTTISTGHYWMD